MQLHQVWRGNYRVMGKHRYIRIESTQPFAAPIGKVAVKTCDPTGKPNPHCRLSYIPAVRFGDTTSRGGFTLYRNGDGSLCR